MFVRVAEVSDVPPGSCKAVDVRGAKVALCNVEGQFYAVEDECPHMGAQLSSGFVVECQISCPWHAWEFELTTGNWTASPNPSTRLKRYAVRVEGPDVLVNSEPEEDPA
jgi:nitrite reductase (NADH) small subunit/3-phenylpropionate/trans-cinnamate dioxygenase ferredoxin subunit